MGFLRVFTRASRSFFTYSLAVNKFYTKKHCFFYSLEFFQSFSTRIYKMNTAYFQRSEGKDEVFISLNYKQNDRGFTFNFLRPISENLDTFFSRAQLKLQTKLSKKFKKKTKNFDDSENLPVISISLLLNNELMSGETTFEDIFQKELNGKLTLRINNVDHKVYLNAPMVLRMSLPTALYAGGIVFPEFLETQHMDEEKSEFVWYKTQHPFKMKDWEKCGEGFFYFIKQEDIDFYLRVVCTPKMNDITGPESRHDSDAKVVEFKAFEEIKKRHEFTKEATKADEFRIVSYNILAFSYTQTKEAKTELFTFCDSSYLDFGYRKNLCILELLGYNADIICMQEVDKFHYPTLQLLFSRKGYGSFFHEKEGSHEGSTLVYNKEKFSLINAKQYIFIKELLSNPLLDDIRLKIQGNENLITRLQGMQTQIQVVVLENLSKNVLIVGNTHFYFHPDADHIRLLQGVLSWKILQKTYEEIKEENPDKKCSILLCGDFNSTPESGFHQFLSTGTVDSDHIGWKSKEDEAIKDLSFQHSFKMKSAYDNTQYTNYTPLFKGCLDYIYYQTDHLKLKQTVPIPSEEVLSRFKGIPSQFFPSDHVALVADFKFEE